MTDSASSVPATPPPTGIDVRDAAWARVPTRLSPEELSGLLADVEVLLRANPYYFFKSWKQLGSNRFHAEFENQSNEQQMSMDIEIVPGPDKGLTLKYSQGLKRRTLFTIEPFPQGSQLVITDDYSGHSEQERSQREAEIDKSLPAWGEALRIYLLRVQRYSRIPGWRWYMRRVWLPMKPAGRRITFVLLAVTAAEVALIAIFMLVYWLEQRG